VSGYIAFTKKEFTENIRNYRSLIMLVLFIFFGVSSPLLAKFSPQLVAAFAINIDITFAEPTALDAWAQFYKNISTLGLSLTIILFSSCLSSEYAKGTLTIMLTKGLSRKAVIMSKFSAAATITTISYWLSFGIAYGYTVHLWPDVELPHVVFAAFPVWVTVLLYLCILMLGCVLFRQAFTSILFLLVATVVMSLLGMASQFEAISPSFLVSKNVDLLSNTVTINQFAIPAITSIIISALLLILSIVTFRKKQL
jgi:ABC-2 type transport system permease protein